IVAVVVPEGDSVCEADRPCSEGGRSGHRILRRETEGRRLREALVRVGVTELLPPCGLGRLLAEEGMAHPLLQQRLAHCASGGHLSVTVEQLLAGSQLLNKAIDNHVSWSSVEAHHSHA